VLHLFCWICFWLLCVEKKEKKGKKQNQTFTPSFQSKQPTLHLSFLFPRAAQPLAPSPQNSAARYTPAGPLTSLSLTHFLTDRRGPPVRVAFNLQPPASLSWPRPAADPGCLFPFPRLLPFPSSAPCTQQASPNPSPSSPPPKWLRTEPPSHQWRSTGVPLHRLGRVPSPPLSTYKSRPQASLQPALLTRAPPLLYTAAPRRPNRSSAPRRRSPLPTLLLPLSFLFEQLSETPCLSYLFWCLFPVVSCSVASFWSTPANFRRGAAAWKATRRPLPLTAAARHLIRHGRSGSSQAPWSTATYRSTLGLRCHLT
jgi:hypothetical protein